MYHSKLLFIVDSVTVLFFLFHIIITSIFTLKYWYQNVTKIFLLIVECLQ